jgi:NAD(P)H-hydrate epimerase
MHLTRAQAQDIDRRAVEAGMLSLVLMENAGRGAVDHLERLGIPGPVLICCGPGNNGGDGLVMARHLDLRGFAVRVAVWGSDERLTPDAAANLRLLAFAGACVERFTDSRDLVRASELVSDVAWIVDALFGTGFRGAPRPPFDQFIAILNLASARRMAVDLPSGLDADTGVPAEPTFRADHTVTFVAPKVGFQNPVAAPFLGQVHVADIGAPRRLWEATG